MRVLTVPNWSFGRDRSLLNAFQDLLEGSGLDVHYVQSDLDHNRTVTAFSGESEAVFETVLQLADLALDRIDLNRHVGVHPRIGALDVCPFVLLPGSEGSEAELIARVERFAQTLAERFALPVFLYERSERGRHEADLPALRKGGFGGMLDQELHPDFGPSRCHPHLGVAVVGVRGFLIALNVDLDSRHASVARDLARRIRALREEGDPRFLGVRALGLLLASRDLIQVSMNLTLPDLTPVDPIVEWIRVEAGNIGVNFAGTELIGVIRDRDLAQATRLRVRDAQIVKTMDRESAA